MATNYLSDDEVFGTSNYLSEDEVFGASAKGGRQELPEDITPSEGRSATPMGAADPRIVRPRDDRGIIQRVGEYLKPAPKSVMEDYVPTAEEKQADIDRRLSYGAGPISSQAQATADAVRSSRGQMASKDATVNKVVKAMDARGEKSFADLVDAANNPVNIRAARDAKAQEFRSAGEWAADTLSNLSQGAIGLVQLPINIISPSSDIAATLSDTQKQLQEQESDVLKAQREQLRERVQNEDGFLDKYAATVVQLVTSPALGLSEAVKQVPNFLGVVGASRLAGAASAAGVGLVGRASPTVALGEAISGGAIQTAARAAGTTAGGVGASMVMAGGDAAGGVYDKLTDPKQTPLSVWKQNPDYQKMVAEGKSSKDAIEEIATTKARMAAIITAPLGLLGFAGAEAAIASRGLGKATAEALTFAGAGKMLAKDLAGEQIEEGGTQFGGNLISRTVDPNQKLTEGVPEAMATALVTSAPFSAAGAASQFQEASAAQAQDIAAERQAVGLFDVNNYDPSLIDPRLTSRQQGDTGPAAPINFTPAGSPTQQAGLVDIVVPTAPETTDVSATSLTSLATPGGGQQPGNQLGGGLDLSGLDVTDAAGQRGGIAGQPGANVPQAGAVPVTGGQPAAGLNRPFERATNQDLMARTEAAIASQENNNAVVQPTEQWFGRKGDGYVTQVDAQQALPGRQRMFPNLSWKVEQLPSGKFRLAGYSATQETNLGTQAPQTIQSQTQGQEAPTAGATAVVRDSSASTSQLQAVQTAGINAGPLELDEPTRASLRLAPQAGMQTIAAINGAINKDNRGNALPANEQVQFNVISTKNLSDSQRVASAVARMLGKTFTVVSEDSGKLLSNGYAQLGGKNIVVASDSTDAPLFVAIHEGYHGLPEAQRKALNAGLLKLFREDRKGEFLDEFSYTEAEFDEEAPAFMAQVISKRADFWEQLREKMGNKEFADVAKVILSKLNQILTGAGKEYGQDFADKYISDIAKARDLLTTAYAEAMQEQGLVPDVELAGDVMMARRPKTDKVGDYEVATAKDGSITVYGDSEAIRAAMPEGTVGRVTKEGIVFTNAAAPRVRAVLEGRQVAYSRGGQVTEKLPTKDGKYLGAPEKFNTPGKIPTLRKILRQLAEEGAPGRYWYENSSREVLKMVGGDVNEARKFVALLAIYSPQAKVDANSTFALRAWAQYKAGQPISVKTGVMDAKAKSALDDVDAFWSGEKTGNFFFNLLREIDPSTAGKQGATIDMWMMRAGQYETDAPSNTQYSFMENETNRLAQELGWEPQQVQAAIWVAMKARMENSGVKKITENTSEKKGWIKFVPGKEGKGKVRVILEAQKHRDNWLKYSFEHDVTKDDTQQAKFDFGDGLKRHIGQVSFEARPGRTSGVLPGIHSAPYAQQVEFQQAVQKAFLNDNGTDELASYLGLLVDSDILAPGVWQGEVSPSTQLGVAMAPAKGEEGKTNVDPAQAKALNIYAAVAGLVARQEGVGWHRPFYASTKRDANGLDINVGRVLNPREVADLEAAVGQWMADNGKAGWQEQFAFVSSPSGIRVVNFGIITNDILQTAIVEVAESVLPDFDYRVFASSGDMPTNNWKENPNGESYVQRIGAEGRSDVLDWARAVLAPRVQRVFDEYSERYDWGDAGKIQFSNRARDGSGRQGPGRAQDRQVQASERADAQTVQGLSANDALPGAPTVQGFTGPDPRLVAVAEQYARDNGITLRRQAEYVQVDPERAARIAQAYEAMPHAPNDLRVKAAYKELIAQTIAQYRALEKAGYKFWFINLNKPDNAEYASSPWNAMRDIRANKQMGVFPTDDGFGSGDFDPASNPLLEDTGIKWPAGSLFGPRKRVLANDLFRAVHDAFGHGLEGAGFRAQGEENAWQAHVRLFTGKAVAAITSETRGQNSWLNYGPNGESNRTAKVEDTVFADQKTGLLPEFAWTEGRVGDMPMFSESDVVSTDNSAADQRIQFSKRAKPAPKKTVTAYKLFRVEKDRPGELFPLFVPVWGDQGPQNFSARDPRRHGEGLPVGEWYDAEVGENAPATKTGKPQVKSKLGGLAFRPGWHAGDLPIATHIGAKSDASLTAPDIRAPNQVWAEVEMPNDVDWQAEATKRGVNKSGKFIAKEAHITDQIPEDGFYRYKTNSNMTGNWLIGGSIKVNRILSDQEVKAINDEAGAADLPRGEKFDAAKYGFIGLMRSNRAPIAVEVSRNTATAKAGTKIVGRAIAWEDSRGKFVIMNTEVRAPYRRRGIASQMYRAIEESSGRQLTPAVSLSDDAFEFWKSFRPEAVALDLRHWKDQLLGARVVKNGLAGRIIKADGGTATMQYDNAQPNGTQSTILRRDLNEALAAGGSPTINFDDTTTDIRRSNRVLEDRAGLPRLAYQGYAKAEVPRVQAARKMAGILAKLDADKITPQEFELQVRLLAERLAEVSATKDANRIFSSRERGADIVREKLIAARRRGEVDSDTTEFALWALQQNPAIAEGLGISVREQPESQRGAAGDYNPAASIMRVFKGSDNTGTAVHEILHHTERMMPEAVQTGIRKEWSQAYAKALKKADPKQRAALEKMLEAMAGSRVAQDAVRKAFSDGTLEADVHYQLTNPSEFWAVNATEILQRRYEAGSWIGKAKQWLSEMVQKAKGLVGMRSNAPVLRGLEAVLNSDGERQSKKMLSDGKVFEDIAAPETAEFKKWFSDSKVVDANGQPLVAYHGSPSGDITSFSNSGRINGGFYFSKSSSLAQEYANGNYPKNMGKGGAVYPVYLSIKNPFVIRRAKTSFLSELKKRLSPGGAELRATETDRLSASMYLSDAAIAGYKAQGYDGIINDAWNEIVAFDPTQIKSAIGNNGDFDATNPDIRRSSRSSVVKSELESLFQDLQDSRGLKLVRANERVAEHPMADAIEYVNANFYDILEQLEDAGAIKINCK